MTGTTWNSTSSRITPLRWLSTPPAAVAAFWDGLVVRRLHRILNAALRAGELDGLNPATLADIGCRRD